MTNEQKALQMVRDIYSIPDDEPAESIKDTLAYQKCLLYFAWQDLKNAILDSVPCKWIRTALRWWLS